MLVSVLCGGFFLFSHTRLAARIPGISPSVRTIILWLGLTDGGAQLFFGHVENYTVPRLFACLFLIDVTRSFDPAVRIRRAEPLAAPGGILPCAVDLVPTALL
jgi:hypothetical protein